MARAVGELARAASCLGRQKGWALRSSCATLTDVDEVEVVVAHQARATLRVGDVFLKVDGDQTDTDVEVEAMTLAPIPTPTVVEAGLHARRSAGGPRLRRRRRGHRRPGLVRGGSGRCDVRPRQPDARP